MSKSIEHDFRALSMHKLHMKQQIADRIRSLACLRAKQQSTIASNSESDQLSNNIALNMQHITRLLGVVGLYDENYYRIIINSLIIVEIIYQVN